MSFRPLTNTQILARPKTKYYGAYPAGFLQRARDGIGCGKYDQVLHVCSGDIRGYKCGPSCKEGHYHGLGTYDLLWDLDSTLSPHISTDVRKSANWDDVILENPQIQGVLADPPYSAEYAKNYLVGPEVLPSPNQIVHDAIRILPSGGRVGILGLTWPRYPKALARQISVEHVLCGNGNLGRTFAVFEKL